MAFHLTHNIKALERDLSDAARNQLPFAASLAINDTLGDIKRNEEKGIAKRFDRPTPFTRKAVGLKRSTKRRLTGAAFIKDAQAEYLETQETGGERRPKGRALVVPVEQRRNKYGNLPRGAVGRLLANPKVFATRPGSRLPGGIYRRTGGKRNPRLRMLVAFEAVTRYAPRFRFIETARKTAEAQFARRFRSAFARAFGSRR